MNLSQASTPIAERLRAARLATRKTQQELAGTRFSKAYISAIERGKMTPSIQALGLLSERLGVPMSFFLGESEVALEALSEGRLVDTSPQREQQLREESALLTLLEAEGWLRQQQPEKVLKLLQTGDEPPANLPDSERPRWRWLLGSALLQLDRPKEALASFKDGLSRVESLLQKTPALDQPVLMELVERLNWAIGVCYTALGQATQALDYHLPGLAAIKDDVIDNPELQLHIYEALSRDYMALNRPEEARQWFEETQAIMRLIEEPETQAQQAWELALAYKARRQSRLAERPLQQAIALFTTREYRQQAAEIPVLLGHALLENKQYQKAEQMLRQGLASAEQAGDARMRGAALSYLSRLLQETGDAAQAIRLAQEAMQVIDQLGDQPARARLLLVLAAAYEAQSQLNEAEQAYKDALRTLEQLADTTLLAQTHESYGMFLERQQRFQEAFAQMQHATRLAAH